jgi:hypothetical protein
MKTLIVVFTALAVVFAGVVLVVRLANYFEKDDTNKS